MEPYRIDVDDDTLTDLRTRLRAARWPDALDGEDDWSWGTPASTLRPLVEHWLDDYDWHATQSRWNALEQVVVPTRAGRLHVVRAGTRGATPLVLLHGWPDGFLRFEKALPLLADRFDIVVPSVPGYGFSERPTRPGTGPAAVADAVAEVMTAFGMERFGVHGGDIGSTIADSIAARHPERVVGLHLGDVPAWRRYVVDPDGVGEDERAFLGGMADWFQTEGAYAALQRTKPQTLGYALTDSPLALAAWFVEKFRAWSDCGGDPFRSFTADELIDDVMLYWVTGTAASAVRHYRESALLPPDPSVRVSAPTGFTIFPKDIAVPPRAYADRFYDVRRFTVAERGGHFGPWEEPELWAADVRAFFDDVQD